MINLSYDEVVYLLGPLIEHREKLERMPWYPKQKEDIQPYSDLIKKFRKYGKSISTKKTRKTSRVS